MATDIVRDLRTAEHPELVASHAPTYDEVLNALCDLTYAPSSASARSAAERLIGRVQYQQENRV
jgi:hypothetical protein